MPLPKGYSLTTKGQSLLSDPNSFLRVPSREEIEVDKENFQASEQLFSEWDWQNEQQLGPQGEALPELAIGWRPSGQPDFGTGLKGWWNKAVSNVRSAWQTGYEEGMQISGVTEFVVKKTKGEEEGAKQIDKLQEANKPKDENQALWAASAEATKEMFNQALWGVLDTLQLGAMGLERAIGTAGYTLADAVDPNREVNEKTLKENWNASALAYAGIRDATLFAEMNRRIDEGMRPDLAREEILVEKPWANWWELGGQLLFDPLNTITVWGKPLGFGKAARVARLEKGAKSALHEIANPVIGRVVSEAVENVGKLDDAAILKNLDELDGAWLKETVETGKNMIDDSTDFRVSALTSEAKASRVANDSSAILTHVANNSDEPLEVIKALKDSMSADKAVRAKAFATMLNFADPVALFSEAGKKTAVMVSKMSEKFGDNLLTKITELKGDRPALIRYLLGTLDDVGQEMYPSVSKIMEAEKAVASGVRVSDATAKLAERGKNIPEYVRNITRFHDKAQKYIGPVNRAFVGAYMGWNPGYAFRNFNQNTLQILMDQGPMALLRGGDNFKTAERINGVLPGAYGTEGAAAALRKTGEARVNAPFLKLSNWFEEKGARQVIGTAYMKSFNKGTKAMVKALTPGLREAGFSDDIIKKLPTYILQNDGDAAKAINAIRADVKAGVIDLFNDIDRIDPKYKSFLESPAVAKWDEYVEKVLKAPTREEAQAAAKKIFDDIAQNGYMAHADGKSAKTIDEIGLQMAEKEAGLTPARGELIAYRQAGNQKAIDAAYGVLQKADNLASQLGLPSGDMKAAHKLYEKTVGNWGETAAQRTRRLNENAMKAIERAKKGEPLESLWKTYGDVFDEPYTVMSREQFIDKVWTSYFQKSSDTWTQAREETIARITGYLDDIANRGGEVPKEWSDLIKAAQDEAAQWDNVVIGKNGYKYAEETRVVNRRGEISTLASKYGISSATEAGVPLDDKILRTINKYGGTNFKSLDDPIDLQLVEEAFKAKAGKTTEVKAFVPKEPYDFLPGSQEFTQYAASQKHYAGLPELHKQMVADALDAGKPVNPQSVLFHPDLETRFPEQVVAADEANQAYWKAVDTVHFDDAGNLIEPARKPILPPIDDEHITSSRAVLEQMPDVKEMAKWVMNDIASNFGKKQLVNEVPEAALKLAEREMKQKLAETKLISSRIAKAERDFTLLNYGEKTYFDVALAYLYPFHFWYTRTYANWLTRIAANPAVLAGYAKYKDTLATVHAGMPEWWKYNINTNDLPGPDVDNPLYFNLEAALWPLQGLTNVDYNDPKKRVNGWTYALDQMGKFGPSTWTPINMVTGLMLYAQGEKEAGERWMGRAIPQSATVKAIASRFGVSNLELDPFVRLLQGNLDSYEEGRVHRALAQMEQETARGDLPYTQEQIQDAAYSQSGDIWDEAVRRAVRGRSGSQIASFLFGVGFKGRTQEDMEIDKFYGDYSRLWTMRPNVTPEEFREGMDALKSKYPFMDTMLLSRRDDVDRDAGLAYLVLNRIPPGQSSQIAEAAGVSPELFDKFFTDKGQIDKWAPADRQRFMSAVLNIAAVLEIPSDMTRGEWTDAKNAYSRMSADAEKQFGDDILDLVDGYYQAKTKSYDAADAYLERHPEVESYMNWKAERVMGSPLLSAYYGGANMVESYERSKMYADIEKQLGAEIFDTIDAYNDLKTFGEPAEVKAFYRQHKREIAKYYDLKDAWTIQINQQVAQLSAHLPEGENSGIREDIDTTSPGAMGLANELQPAYQPSYEDFAAQIPDRLMNLVQDYMYNGEPLQESARKQLERLAREMGYNSSDDLLQAIGTSLYAQTP
jgi:hypothetical protein